MAGRKTVADFPESEVAINVSYYLAQLSHRNRQFWIRSISPSKERSLGYDARMDSNVSDFVPFYMQFKRPFLYPHNSWSKIVRQRKLLKANTIEQSLAFRFLPKKFHHDDFQHNILFNLSESGIGHAAYVCPLFTNGERYSQTMRGRYFHSHPYIYESQNLIDEEYFYEHHHVPFIRSHITIIPHAKITHARHHYSFDADGDDLCFHKPKVLVGKHQTLEEFVDELFGNFKAENSIHLKSSEDSLGSLIAKTLGELEYTKLKPSIFENELSAISRWGLWGNYLRRHYGIQQFFMTRPE